MFSFLRAPDWETDGATWPHRDASRFVDAGDYCWHVQRMGAGPAALLLHGAGAASHSWAGIMPGLAQRFDVVACDLPGHGFTRAHRRIAPSLDHISGAVADLIDAMKLAPELIVGHSAGAAIMIRMVTDARAAPRAVVSLNGALEPFGGAAGGVYSAMAKMLAYNPAAALAFSYGGRSRRRVERLVEQTGSSIDPGALDHYAALMRRPAHIAGALAMMAHWDLADMAQNIARLPMRACFIAGANDAAIAPDNSRRAAARAPLGDAVILPDLGHLAHEEAPDAIVELLVKVASEDDSR